MVLLDTPTMNSPNLIISLLLHLPCPHKMKHELEVSMVRRPSKCRVGQIEPTRGYLTLLFELRPHVMLIFLKNRNDYVDIIKTGTIVIR